MARGNHDFATQKPVNFLKLSDFTITIFGSGINIQLTAKYVPISVTAQDPSSHYLFSVRVPIS